MKKSPFLNQRPSFRNLSPPYAAKTLVNPRGYFPSRKNKRQIAFWDLRELNFIMLAEASRDILSFEERPELIQMRAGAAWLNYTPHFCVVLDGGVTFVELSHLGAPSTLAQNAVAVLVRAKFSADGLRFAELSHAQVRTEPYYSNAMLMLRFMSVDVTEEQVLRVRDVLAHGAATLCAVEAASGLSKGCLLAMALRGDVEVEVKRPICPESLIGLIDAGVRQ